MIQEVQKHYIQSRLSEIDSDFLSYEEDMIQPEDLKTITYLLSMKDKLNHKLKNPHNSCILYTSGLTDVFDHQKARSDTIGGSPPDVDLDFASSTRAKAIDEVVKYWGREQVANIMTKGQFKIKSLTEDFFRINEPNPADFEDENKFLIQLRNHHLLLAEIKGKIPPPQYGKEPSLEEVIKGSSEKGYDPHPELATLPKYQPWYQFASHIEGMIRQLGVHAGGIVISNDPISDHIPIWCNKDKNKETSEVEAVRWITQFDMNEVQDIGLIKWDFLAIENLDIVNETIKLIETKHNIKLSPYEIPDYDKPTYDLMARGLLTGIFQMETSRSAKDLIVKVKPQSIGEISDISSINRPGPLNAGFDVQYIKNKEAGHAPRDLPPQVAEILKKSWWVLIYQESVMEICTKLGGFSPRESDDIRRSMGKKKKSVLEAYYVKFQEGCLKSGLTKEYTEKLWTDLVGFADYCLAGATKIITNLGPKTIEEIVNNRLQVNVLSLDLETNLLEWLPITQWHSKGMASVVEYTLADGSSVLCTPDHLFLSSELSYCSFDDYFLNKSKVYKVT